jgi:hypothetical protein
MSKTTKIVIGAAVAVAALACVALLTVVLLGQCRGEDAAADPLTGTQWQVRSFYDPQVVGGMASPLGGTQ